VWVLFLVLLFRSEDSLAWLDESSSRGNLISTASVTVNIDPATDGLVDEATASDINYFETVERDFIIDNDGSEDVQYTIEYENISGVDDMLCQTLGVEATLNGEVIYDIGDGPLSPSAGFDGFSYKVNNLSSGESDSWELNITWYEMANRETYEGQTCEFKFVVDAWQKGYNNSSKGWSDSGELDDNIISVQDGTPPVISNVDSSEPVDTRNEANSIQVDITWDTDENATSKVVYDTVDHVAGTWEDYANSAPSPEDTSADNTSHEVRLSGLDASTTYYYRVVSEDANGNLASSDQEGFLTNDPDNVVASTDIVMNEFLPDPVGDDDAAMPDGEWVELYNRGASDVDVDGWYLKDGDGNQLDITALNSDSNGDISDAGETIVEAGSYLVIYDNSSFNLGNSDEWIYLYDFGDNLIDDYSFGYAGDYIALHEGKTYARIPDGGFWVDPDGTPGEENELGDEETRIYREAAFENCFEGREFDESQKNKDICSLDFLEYLRMIKSKDNLRIPTDVYETLIESVEEVEINKDSIVPVETEEDNPVTKNAEEAPIKLEEEDDILAKEEELDEKESQDELEDSVIDDEDQPLNSNNNE